MRAGALFSQSACAWVWFTNWLPGRFHVKKEFLLKTTHTALRKQPSAAKVVWETEASRLKLLK